MKVAVMGVAGRMGQELVRAAHAAGCTIVGAVERAGSTAVGADVGIVAGLTPLGVAVTSDAIDVISRCEGILDFTSPKATVEFAALAANARAVHVIGTTGLTASDEAHIAAAARHAPIIKAGNMSLGVNLLVALTRRAAEALDEDFDIEIVEMHHRDKVDAPSGTALMLGAAAAEGRAIDLQKRSVKGRDGITGPRQRGDIGFATLRGGSVVGEHKVIFAGAGERIELAHVAGDRSVFARGAVKALRWGQGKAPGLYSMTDVLGL